MYKDLNRATPRMITCAAIGTTTTTTTLGHARCSFHIITCTAMAATETCTIFTAQPQRIVLDTTVSAITTANHSYHVISVTTVGVNISNSLMKFECFDSVQLYAP